MEAYFDRTNHPKVEIIIGGRKQKRLLTALLDTGFDGHLSIPINIAIQLGLELVNIERVQYADGRISNELVFAVNVEVDGKNQGWSLILILNPAILRYSESIFTKNN